MVNPQDSRMLHVGTQRCDERREPLPLQHQWIDRRQTPILPATVERVRGRADRCSRGARLRTGPGFGAIGIRSHGQITVEPDRQSSLAASSGSRSELSIRLPLQELEELDAIAVRGSKISYLLRPRVAHWRRPAPPGELKFLFSMVLLQRLEHGKVSE